MGTAGPLDFQRRKSVGFGISVQSPAGMDLALGTPVSPGREVGKALGETWLVMYLG